MYKKALLIIFAFMLSKVPLQAQWSVGSKVGMTHTGIERSNMGRIDESYTPLNDIDFGIKASYRINDWLAIRADIDLMRRSHRMDRNLPILDSVFTEHHNTYLMLPVMADFSFGGNRLRGHALCGAYAGVWTRDHTNGITYWMTDYYIYFNGFEHNREFTDEDNRICAGLTGGIRITFDLSSRWTIGIESLMYYDLTSHHKSSSHLSDPRYLNTIATTIGMTYKLY